jgi:hypothetical protein
MAAALFLILLGVIYLQYQTSFRRRIPKAADSIIHGIGMMLVIGGIVLIVLYIIRY